MSSIDLINVAVARLAGSRAMSEIEADIKAACVVIGGGVAGMAAATAVAARGIDVTVVEKRDHLGGYLFQAPLQLLSRLPCSPGMDPVHPLFQITKLLCLISPILFS